MCHSLYEKFAFFNLFQMQPNPSHHVSQSCLVSSNAFQSNRCQQMHLRPQITSYLTKIGFTTLDSPKFAKYLTNISKLQPSSNQISNELCLWQQRALINTSNWTTSLGIIILVLNCSIFFLNLKIGNGS